MERNKYLKFAVINGTHESIDKDSYAPADVMNALRQLGWAIPPGEQDAHELFHVLLTSLDEETPKINRTVSQQSIKNVTHKMLNFLIFQAGCLSDAIGLDNLEWTDPPPDEEDNAVIDPSASILSLNDLASSISSEDGMLSRPRTLRWGGRLTRKHRWISRSCRSLKFSLAGPPPLPVSHPFCGTLTSQLKCTECGFKSPVR